MTPITLEEIWQIIQQLRRELDELKGKVSTLENIQNAMLDVQTVGKVVKKANGREKLYRIVILVLSIALIIVSYVTGVTING